MRQGVHPFQFGVKTRAPETPRPSALSHVDPALSGPPVASGIGEHCLQLHTLLSWVGGVGKPISQLTSSNGGGQGCVSSPWKLSSDEQKERSTHWRIILPGELGVPALSGERAVTARPLLRELMTTTASGPSLV